MEKRRRLDYWSYSYSFKKQEEIFLCIVQDLVVGISENSFEEAFEDARLKLYQVPNLPFSQKPNGITVCIETYNHQHNEIHHIFL